MEYTQEELDAERLRMTLAINTFSAEREELERRHGKVWSTAELGTDFEVVGFAAPFIVVKRRDNGEVGSLEFQHMPRYYFKYRKDE
jgi:hypothetical protein